jgi:Flp pilus assembly protein TadD
MPHQAPQFLRFKTAHLMASAAVVAVLALGAAGCKTTSEEVTGSVGSSPTPRSESDWRRSLDVWGSRYRENQSDPEIAINYARALRATEQRAQAVAVLEQAALRNPKNMELLGAYGRALADAGNYNQALEVLSRAHTPDQPDWLILNAQGAVLDQLGRHSEAQRHYSAALKIMPNEPSILSNLGLSYALSKDLHRAETTLRQASGRPSASAKVRQNLALVVALQGRFPEAEQIASADLSPEEAAANVSYLRKMVSERGEWMKKGGMTRVPPPDSGT